MGGEESAVAADIDRRGVIPEIFPDWAPADVVEWLGSTGWKAPAGMSACFVSLVSDPRMREVWNWHTNAVDTKGFGFCSAVHASIRLPSFPGNLSAVERKTYLAKVQKHAMALIELLGSTRYGRNSATIRGFSTEEIDNEKLAEIVERDLADWGEDETGHVVAYYVDEDGVSRMPWDYPESSLCDLLYDVVGWTELDNYWDIMRSSKPIEATKGSHRNVTYFTRTLYEKLQRHAVTIPFPHLATVANVALALPVDAQLDEDAVRKQVRRYKCAQDITPVYGPDAF